MTLRDGSPTGWPSLMPTNELPSLTCVVHRMRMETSSKLLLLSSKMDSPLLCAIDFYTKQGWVIHVFPWVVGIHGLLHPPHICAALQFLEVPHQHWPLAVESTVLASVNAFYFYTVCYLVAPLRAVCVQLVVTVQNRKRMLQTRPTWRNSWRVKVSVDLPGVLALVLYPSWHLSY